MFKDRIKKLRAERHMTQADLASVLFVTQQSVSRWETGRSYPDLPTLRSISIYFETKIDDLIDSAEYVEAKAEKRIVHSQVFFIALWDAVLLLSVTALYIFARFYFKPSNEWISIVYSGMAFMFLASLTTPIVILVYWKNSKAVATFGLAFFSLLSAFSLGVFSFGLYILGPSSPFVWMILFASFLLLTATGFFIAFYVRSRKALIANGTNGIEDLAKQRKRRNLSAALSVFFSLGSLLLSILVIVFRHNAKWLYNGLSDGLFSAFFVFFLAAFILEGIVWSLLLFALTKESRKRMVLSALLFTAIIVSFAAPFCAGVADNMAYEKTYSYETDKWMNAKPEDRYRIWPYFEKEHIIIGDAKETIIAYLGEPDNGKETDSWFYDFGFAPGFSIDPTVLKITFGETGVVASYQVYET